MTLSPENKALEPCPWCGSAAKTQGGTYGYAIWIGCPNRACPMGSSCQFHTEAEAITAWNTRASLPQPTGPDADLIAAVRAPSFRQDSQWHDPKAVYATKPRALLDEIASRLEALTSQGTGEEFLEFKEALSDLRSLRHEYEDLNGGGPGWAARYKAAWTRADELFANEDEPAYDRQQEDAHG